MISEKSAHHNRQRLLLSQGSKANARTLTWRLWLATALISSQSLTFGYVFASLNTSLVTGHSNNGRACYDGEDDGCPKGSIYDDFEFTTFEASLAVATLVGCGWLASLFADYPLEILGRRRSLLANALLYIVGASLTSCGNYDAFFFGRCISGLASGIVTVMVPILLSEIADPPNRGSITTTYQVTLTLGIFAVGLMGYGFVTYVNHGWMYLQALSAVPSVVLLVLQCFVPESPKWLLRKGRSDEAEQTLRYLRPPGYNIQPEIDGILAEMEGDKEEAQATWQEVFVSPRRIAVGCVMMWLQSFTGVNSITFYSTTIFGFAGFKEAILATASTGGVNFVMTFVTSAVSDRYGRKTLILYGTCVMWVSLLALALVLDKGNSVPKAQGVVAVISALLFICGFAPGFGATVWVVMAEMMPNRLRAKAMSLFLFNNWCSDFIIAMTTLSLIDALGGVSSSMTDRELEAAEKDGVAKLYYIFLGITTFALGFIYVILPETKDSTPDQILRHLQRDIFYGEHYQSVEGCDRVLGDSMHAHHANHANQSGDENGYDGEPADMVLNPVNSAVN